MLESARARPTAGVRWECEMTTTTVTDAPIYLTRSFTPQECDAMVAAGIITADQRGDVLAGVRRFTVDEYMAMGEVGILGEASIMYERGRVELLDGEIVIKEPMGPYHLGGTTWLTMLLVPPLVGRALVQIQGTIYLDDRSAPEPDIAVHSLEHSWDRVTADDVYFVIEVADTSLAYDQGVKLARYAAAGIPEVWILNLRAREVTTYKDREGSGYATVRTYRPGESISPRSFPDVVLAVADFVPPADEDL